MPDYYVDLFTHLSKYTENWVKLAMLWGNPVLKSAIETVKVQGALDMISGVIGFILAGFALGYANSIGRRPGGAYSSEKVNQLFLCLAAIASLFASIWLVGTGFDMYNNPLIYAVERLVK